MKGASFMPFFKSEFVKERGAGQKLLSAAYREYLGRLVPQEYLEQYRLAPGSTWADAIALQVVKKAIGIIGKDKLCFDAITELRETTEGKTAERLVTAGNEELAALARAISGPVLIDGNTGEVVVESED